MNKSEFIFVGADPDRQSSESAFNPGGQLTASIGLKKYALSKNYSLTIIDTYQTSFPVPPWRVRVMRGVKRIFCLIRQLQAKKITGIIIFSSNSFSFYERILMAAIARVSGVETLFFIRSGHFVGWVNKSRYKRLLTKILLKIPNFLGIQGDSWRSFYENLNVSPSKMITIRNWLPESVQFAVHPISLAPNEVICFSFVGWLVEEKGVNELFEAILSLKKNYIFKFSFIGGGTLQSLLEQKIKENELTHHVTVTGWLSPEQVNQHLKSTHVFVLPSKAEGFPNALLEALALGLPAICTNVGAISDSLFDGCNGFLLRDGTKESIQDAMECYILSPDLIRKHSAEALRIAKENHDCEKNCNALFSHFFRGQS